MSTADAFSQRRRHRKKQREREREREIKSCFEDMWRETDDVRSERERVSATRDKFRERETHRQTVYRRLMCLFVLFASLDESDKL